MFHLFCCERTSDNRAIVHYLSQALNSLMFLKKNSNTDSAQEFKMTHAVTIPHKITAAIAHDEI